MRCDRYPSGCVRWRRRPRRAATPGRCFPTDWVNTFRWPGACRIRPGRGECRRLFPTGADAVATGTEVPLNVFHGTVDRPLEGAVGTVRDIDVRIGLGVALRPYAAHEELVGDAQPRVGWPLRGVVHLPRRGGCRAVPGNGPVCPPVVL